MEAQQLEAHSKVSNVPIQLISIPDGFPNRDQRGDIDALMHSMEKHGLLQPMVLRRNAKKYGFELVAGYRRLLAAKRAGWETVPATVLEDVNDEKLLTLKLVENLHRKDLEVYEVVTLLHELRERYGLTYRDLAVHLGLSHSYTHDLLS